MTTILGLVCLALRKTVVKEFVYKLSCIVESVYGRQIYLYTDCAHVKLDNAATQLARPLG